MHEHLRATGRSAAGSSARPPVRGGSKVSMFAVAMLDFGEVPPPEGSSPGRAVPALHRDAEDHG